MAASGLNFANDPIVILGMPRMDQNDDPAAGVGIQKGARHLDIAVMGDDENSSRASGPTAWSRARHRRQRRVSAGMRPVHGDEAVQRTGARRRGNAGSPPTSPHAEGVPQAAWACERKSSEARRCSADVR